MQSSSESEYNSDYDYCSDLVEIPLSQYFTGRFLRSQTHPIRLLHHASPNFFILGKSGNVYTVKISTDPTCTCSESTTPCKHILFIYTRVLYLPLDDPCFRHRTLQESDVTRLLSTPVSDKWLAGEAIRERFHEMHGRRNEKKRYVSVVVEGLKCRVCLETMGGDGKRTAECCTCKNVIHDACLVARGDKSCFVCSASWEDDGEEDVGYVNLSKYNGFCGKCGDRC